VVGTLPAFHPTALLLAGSPDPSCVLDVRRALRALEVLEAEMREYADELGRRLAASEVTNDSLRQQLSHRDARLMAQSDELERMRRELAAEKLDRDELLCELAHYLGEAAHLRRCVRPSELTSARNRSASLPATMVPTVAECGSPSSTEDRSPTVMHPGQNYPLILIPPLPLQGVHTTSRPHGTPNSSSVSSIQSPGTDSTHGDYEAQPSPTRPHGRQEPGFVRSLSGTRTKALRTPMACGLSCALNTYRRSSSSLYDSDHLAFLNMSPLFPSPSAPETALTQHAFLKLSVALAAMWIAVCSNPRSHAGSTFG